LDVSWFHTSPVHDILDGNCAARVGLPTRSGSAIQTPGCMTGRQFVHSGYTSKPTGDRLLYRYSQEVWPTYVTVAKPRAVYSSSVAVQFAGVLAETAVRFSHGLPPILVRVPLRCDSARFSSQFAGRRNWLFSPFPPWLLRRCVVFHLPILFHCIYIFFCSIPSLLLFYIPFCVLVIPHTPHTHTHTLHLSWFCCTLHTHPTLLPGF